MSLSLGIVGLPNVGKSTLLNALSRQTTAQAANYPFCTIEPNRAMVSVPDKRLQQLAELVNPARVMPAMVEIVDIAGLVKGASKGEGLGNQFLGHIRATNAICHVIRCFDDPDIIHVDSTIDPVRDAAVVELELTLADLQTIEKRLDTLAKKLRTDKTLQSTIQTLTALRDHVGTGQLVSTFPDHAGLKDQLAELQLLTDKQMIYCANVDESGLLTDPPAVQKLRDYAAKFNAPVIKVCAKVEEELAGLNDAEAEEFLTDLGVKESGLSQIIHAGYNALGFISYFTAGPKEVRAWTIHNGWKAPQAASVIHTDFEKGFIRAEVISCADYLRLKSEAACKQAGVMRVEGRDYIVADGDVMHFRFNV